MYPIDLFHRTVRATPDAIALIDETGETPYRALAAEVESLAAALQAIDPEPLSRVGICAYNTREHVVAWLAVLAAHKTWVPLYPRTSRAEIGRLIDFTEASIVIADEDCLDLVTDTKARVIVASPRGSDTTGGLREAHAGKRPQFHALPLDGTQAIKFTGGTTGLPKGVMQPFRAWNANIVTQIAAWKLGPRDRYLTAAPITHGTSTYLMPIFASGGAIVLVDRPRPQEVLQHLVRYDVTTLFVPPTLIYMMLAAPEARDMAFPRLRNLVYGAGPMRPEAIGEAQDLFGPVIASTYGQTEAPQIMTFISGEDLTRPEKRASVGRPTMLTRVAIMDKEGRLLPPGETGEIVGRGDLLMTGYWRQPDKTEETIVEGWLHTGDLGTFDEEGFLFINGRAKDVIITGGFNVYPADVERVLGTHPAVHDCAIFGTPDDKWGEAVRAAVHLRPGASVSSEELIAFVKAELGSVKAPKSLTFYDELPRNAYGKLQRQVLVDDATKLQRQEA